MKSFLNQSLKIFAFILLISSSLALNRTDCKCKILNQISNRIVGGKETKTVYPFLATFFTKKNQTIQSDEKNKTFPTIHLCHGIIINQRQILTAATCAFKDSEKIIDVSYGSNDLMQLYDNRHQIDYVISHPNLTFHQKDGLLYPVNDISIVFLKDKIKFSEKVGPACLNLNNVKEYTDVLSTIGNLNDNI